MKLTVAAAQIRASAVPSDNLGRIDAAARSAAGQEAQLVVFPEAAMACFGTRLRDIAEPLDGPFATGVRELAAKLGIWLVVGMFTPAEDGRVHNTLIASNGEELHSYNKIHLYDAFGGGESKVVAPGQDVVTFDALGTTIGLATCYDVRFAEQFTELGRRDARLVCLPASWGDGPGKAAQWKLLTAARAMDAQAVLIAADQPLVPDQGKNPLGVGCSQIVGPDGAVLAAAGQDESVLVAQASLDAVDRFRAAVPILDSPPTPAMRNPA